MKNLILLLLVVVACQPEYDGKEENVSSDHILFGHFYGECMGEQCVEIYKLTERSLYEDTRDEYPSSNQAYNGDFQPLSSSMFAKVNDIKDEIPSELLTISSVVIGQPDAGDWGGIYFEIVSNGEKRFWLIDKAEANIPQSIRPLVSKIESNIAAINK